VLVFRDLRVGVVLEDDVAYHQVEYNPLDAAHVVPGRRAEADDPKLGRSPGNHPPDLRVGVAAV
jgi:hypothetical protein